MDPLQLISHYWPLLVILYGWLQYAKKAQAKKVAQLKAEREKREPLHHPIEEMPEWMPKPDSSTNVANDVDEKKLQLLEHFYNNDIYAFDSPVAQEEKEDQQARAAAFNFIPADKEGYAPEKEYTFKAEGDFPTFTPPKEDVRSGEYFPMGLSANKESYLTAAEIRKAIITMEVLLPPRSKCPRR